MDGILLATWLAAGVVVVLYVLFVVWHVRVHRRREGVKSKTKAAGGAESIDDDRLARALDAAARIAGQAPQQPTPPPAAAPASPIQPAPVAPPPPTPSPTSVADVLAGIRLPNDLAPLTTMAPRMGAGDRVAFWTDDAGVEVVGPAFVDELRRIGCEVKPIDTTSYAIIRDAARAVVMFHPDGRVARIDDLLAFPSVPAAVVVEIWILT